MRPFRLSTPEDASSFALFRPSKVPNREPAMTAAHLPRDLRRIVDDVLKRSKLWPRERSDVEAELAAHFTDGLEAGIAPEKLIEDFGDTRKAAALIRLGKIRNRPLRWRVGRMSRRVIYSALAITLVFYGLLAARFYVGTPKITRNVQKELNASTLAIPEKERAWPLYREAFLAVVNPPTREATEDEKAMGKKLPPTNPFESSDGARVNARALGMARQASQMSQLGAILGDPADHVLTQHTMKLLGDKNWQSVAANATEENPFVFHVSFTPLHPMRQFAHLLLQDVADAIEARDAVRVGADLVAVARIGLHLRQFHFLICDLIAMQIQAGAMDRVRQVLTDTPELMDNYSLKSFAAALQSIGPRSSLIRFENERKTFEDLLQRSFTDDGHGDGRLTREGLKLLIEMVRWNPDMKHEPDIADTAILPFTSTFGPGRRELREQYVSLLQSQEDWSKLPAWQRSTAPEIPKFKPSLDKPTSLSFLPFLLTSWTQSIWAADRFDAERQATLAIIAIEQFKRANGRLPDSLDDLVPTFLAELPLDLADGHPLRFKRVGDSYVLYSLGADKKDDGGTHAPDAAHAVGIANFNWPIAADQVSYDWVFFPFVKSIDIPPKDTNYFHVW